MTSTAHLLARVCALALACAAGATRAQDAPAPDAETESGFALPALEVVAFDLLLSNFNRATSRSHDYDVSWHSIEHNLRGPWVVDNDPFAVNQFGHPYQGSLYHSIGRSLGLNYWQASALTFAGSAWWEITGEKTPPSKNDQVASGIAGSFFGEPLFRMAHLVGDHSTVPAAWRPWLASAISPPVGFNRLAFGSRYGAVFEDHDPAYYSRLHVGGSRVTNDNFATANGVKTYAAQVDFAMDYGLPGKPGYSYNRPFDYFNFEAALSSSNAVENLTSNGMLLGDHYALGDRVRGIAGIYGGYEYLAPQVYHVSSTSVSIGTTLQWWASERVAVQGGLSGGIGYAAASTILHRIGDPVSDRDYHYGMAPRAAMNLRVIGVDRVSLDVAGRMVSLGRIARRQAGRDDISRLETALTWRISGPHAVGLSYVWSHRSAAFPSSVDQRQTLGQFGIYYTLLGQQDFGAVEWRHPDTD
jgi:Domain of unknown function (DUF3943)